MAKKGKELTLEEKLEQTLVPAEEQPYEVPENWCWVRLLASFDNLTDSKKKIKQKDYLSEGKFAIVDQGQELIGGYTNDETMLCTHLKPVIVFGDHTRCVKYINFDFVQGADGVKILQPKNFWVERFFYYAMLNLEIPNLGYRRHFPLFNTFKIPLPPLAEQQRIVDRIESLFAKLDEAKEKIQSVIDTSVDRKAAIQYKAFYGELSREWRKENGLEKKNWKEKTLQDVCVMKITDGTHQTPTYCEKEVGVPFISAKDVTSGMINWNDIKYIIPELHEELYKRIAPQKGDVLLAKNGTTGISALVEDDKVFDIYVTLAVLRPDIEQIYPEYLHYIVNSTICKTQFDEHLTGIGVPNLHLRDIKEVHIPVPSLDEQKAIIHILDDLYKKEDIVCAIAEDIVEKIDFMKKSILAKAFRGELGTNDLSDESAIELLKSVLEVNL